MRPRRINAFKAGRHRTVVLNGVLNISLLSTEPSYFASRERFIERIFVDV